VEIDRRILIFDAASGELQQLALDLIGFDFDVHYANDVDEAQILARESKGRLNAVLFTPSSDGLPISELSRRFGVAPAAFVPVGARPADDVIGALAADGVRWHLWDGPTQESTRFVISSVLFEQDPLEIRYHRRIPMNLPARIEIDAGKADTTIRDISLGGACLFGGIVGSIGDQGRIIFAIDEEEIELPVGIAWAVGEPGDNARVAGVSFLEVSPTASDVLGRLLESVIARHRVEKPS
jgi:hypothetical protein